MKKLKEAVRKAYAGGTFNTLTPAEQILFNMVDTTETNLLDAVVITQSFEWYVDEWVNLLRKYEVEEILIPFSRIHTNSGGIQRAFEAAGFEEIERFETATSINYTMLCVRMRVV